MTAAATTPDELVDADPLLKASWGVASHYITERLTLEEFEQIATDLNEDASLDRALHKIRRMNALRRHGRTRWEFHALKSALCNLNKTTEYGAYRSALYEGANVPLVDWVRATQGKAQDRMAALIDSADEAIALRA